MISDTGYWNISGTEFTKEHIYDSRLSDAIIAIAKSKSIKQTYDFGSGHGEYTANFIASNINCIGFDGNPITSTIPNCKVQDLTDRNWQREPVDFLLCLEVCEHVPKEYELALIDSIVRHLNHGGTVILSWAIPGQGGLGHVNCQTNEYVIKLFQKRGFVYNKEESDFLRKHSVEPWFNNTILVFQKGLAGTGLN